ALSGQRVDVLDDKLTGRGVAIERGDRRAGHPDINVAQVAAARVHADAVAVDQVPDRWLAGLHLQREIAVAVTCVGGWVGRDGATGAHVTTLGRGRHKAGAGVVARHGTARRRAGRTVDQRGDD